MGNRRKTITLEVALEGMTGERLRTAARAVQNLDTKGMSPEQAAEAVAKVIAQYSTKCVCWWGGTPRDKLTPEQREAVDGLAQATLMRTAEREQQRRGRVN